MDVVAESVVELHEHAERVAGLGFTYEPEFLRFFQARFEPVGAPGIFRQAEVHRTGEAAGR